MVSLSLPANVLTMVLKAVDLNDAHAFGDGQAYGNKPILRVTTGANEPPVVVITAKELTDQDRSRLNGGVERIIQKSERDEMLRRLTGELGKLVKRTARRA